LARVDNGDQSPYLPRAVYAGTGMAAVSTHPVAYDGVDAMFWEEYGVYILIGVVFALLMIGLLIAEMLIVRANRRLIRDSTRELAQLLANAGKAEEGRQLARAVDDVLEDQRQRVLGRLKRRRELHRER